MAAYYTDGETLNSPENLLLDETRQQLRIIGNEQDSQLLGYLRLAIELIERYIWRNLFVSIHAPVWGATCYFHQLTRG